MAYPTASSAHSSRGEGAEGWAAGCALVGEPADDGRADARVGALRAKAYRVVHEEGALMQSMYADCDSMVSDRTAASERVMRSVCAIRIVEKGQGHGLGQGRPQ